MALMESPQLALQVHRNVKRLRRGDRRVPSLKKVKKVTGDGDVAVDDPRKHTVSSTDASRIVQAGRYVAVRAPR